MKLRNYIMANVAKNDPTRYHTRSVDAEHIKLQKNRARRRVQERKEICEGSAESGLSSSEKEQRETGIRISTRTPLPPPKVLTEEDKKIILEQARLWDIDFYKRVRKIEVLI